MHPTGCYVSSQDPLQPSWTTLSHAPTAHSWKPCAPSSTTSTLPGPRDPRGVRRALSVLLATLLVALAGGANSLAAVAAFTHDHLAWFRLWLPLGIATPSRDTYLRLVRGWTSRRP